MRCRRGAEVRRRGPHIIARVLPASKAGCDRRWAGSLGGQTMARSLARSMLVFALTAACAPSLSHAAEPAPQPPSPAALAAFVASLKPAAEARGVSACHLRRRLRRRRARPRRRGADAAAGRAQQADGRLSGRRRDAGARRGRPRAAGENTATTSPASSAASACRVPSWWRSGGWRPITARRRGRRTWSAPWRRSAPWATGPTSTATSSWRRSTSCSAATPRATRCAAPGRAPWASRSSCRRAS